MTDVTQAKDVTEQCEQIERVIPDAGVVFVPRYPVASEYCGKLIYWITGCNFDDANKAKLSATNHTCDPPSIRVFRLGGDPEPVKIDEKAVFAAIDEGLSEADTQFGNMKEHCPSVKWLDVFYKIVGLHLPKQVVESQLKGGK